MEFYSPRLDCSRWSVHAIHCARIAGSDLRLTPDGSSNVPSFSRNTFSEIIAPNRVSRLLHRNLDAILPPQAVCRITTRIATERCWSGRTGLPAKQLSWQNRDRGFESPPLRQIKYRLVLSIHHLFITRASEWPLTENYSCAAMYRIPIPHPSKR